MVKKKTGSSRDNFYREDHSRYVKKFGPPTIEGLRVKKQFGQHFLRNQAVIDQMINKVTLAAQDSVFEVGCGDGFLTRSILQTAAARLWVFEIDPDWASYVQAHYADDRMRIFQENILDVDFARFEENAPWTLLANLPYQITFPILHMLQKNKHLLKEGVIMVQEEVAQKIVAQSGRGYGVPSLFFQHHFTWELLGKIPPTDFYPAPKVFSRLLYFKPRTTLREIPDEERFWKFLKACFHQPRRTLGNNLSPYSYNISTLSPEKLNLRAQQMNMDDFISLWNQINHTNTPE